MSDETRIAKLEHELGRLTDIRAIAGAQKHPCDGVYAREHSDPHHDSGRVFMGGEPIDPGF